MGEDCKMTSKELEHIKMMNETLREIRDSNRIFIDKVSDRITTAEKKIEEKHIPISLEGDILKTVQLSVNESIKAVLTGYNSPMSKLVCSVIEDHNVELKSIFSNAFSSVIKTREFEQSIVSAFSHKIARSMMSMSDSLFEKVSNDLKQDVQFKARMVVAISNIVEEYIKDKN